ncbi:MAG: hypothetical protein ACI8XB_002891, partial [Patiriisocius sp.]
NPYLMLLRSIETYAVGGKQFSAFSNNFFVDSFTGFDPGFFFFGF